MAMPGTEERPGERLLTVADVAAEVGVGEETVRRWLRRKELRGIMLARKAGYRVRASDLQAYLDRRANVAPGAEATPPGVVQ